jgi:hypothetical protein
MRNLPVFIVGVMAILLLAATGGEVSPGLSQTQAKIYIVPTQATLPPNTVFGLRLDAGASQIAFVRLELAFDPTKVYLTDEIQTTSLFGTVIETTGRIEANTTGHIVVVLALSPGSKESPPTGNFELAQLSFGALRTLPDQASTISVAGQQTQIVTSDSIELSFSSELANLTLNPSPYHLFLPAIRK